jgi:Golgi apparatus protein 1
VELADVKPGMGHAKACLEENRDKADFSPECKAKFEEMMVRRASDFRLDETLRSECRDDIEEVCGYEKDSLDTIAGYDGRVIECLQDYRVRTFHSLSRYPKHAESRGGGHGRRLVNLT